MTIYTVGHSTHELGALVALLAAHGVDRLVDVRTAPRSRRTPQFNTEALARELPAAGIDYAHLPELGGWRSPAKARDDNAGWRNRSFRGYADHMASPEFKAGLARLLALASERRTGLMCAEAAWWRCHRRLIADTLVAAGLDVCHIASDGRLSRHEITPFARLGEDGSLRYPPQDGQLELGAEGRSGSLE